MNSQKIRLPDCPGADQPAGDPSTAPTENPAPPPDPCASGTPPGTRPTMVKVNWIATGSVARLLSVASEKADQGGHRE